MQQSLGRVGSALGTWHHTLGECCQSNSRESGTFIFLARQDHALGRSLDLGGCTWVQAPSLLGGKLSEDGHRAGLTHISWLPVPS